jgi:phosphate transport system protein
MATQRTVRSYESELENVDRHILAMGGLVEDQLRNAIKALFEGDDDLARRVIDHDHVIDDHEREVDELVTRIIALRQPLAEDLRRVKTALKVAANLERMGDLAANISKRSLVIEDVSHVPQREALRRLGTAVHGMTVDVVDAFRDGNAVLARRVWNQDEQIDEMYNSVFLAILADMISNPKLIAPGTHIHFVAKNIERIGDHATNIAEMVHYMIQGQMPGEDRPKASSVVTVEDGKAGGQA